MYWICLQPALSQILSYSQCIQIYYGDGTKYVGIFLDLMPSIQSTTNYCYLVLGECFYLFLLDFSMSLIKADQQQSI